MTGQAKTRGEAKRRIDDPIERIVADALDAADIAYTHESESIIQNIDFALVDGPLIECKQFATDRTSAQIKPHPDIIVIQGREAALWFAAAINGAAK